MSAEVAPSSQWRAKRRRVFQSVFATDSSQLAPPTTPSQAPTDQGHGHALRGHRVGPDVGRDNVRAADHQRDIDCAWHTVTSRLQLPSSVTVQDSFGALPPESQFQGDDSVFDAAIQLLFQARETQQGVGQSYDILEWHSHQVRCHFIQHVLPLLAAVPGPNMSNIPSQTNSYDYHMTLIQNAVQALETALRQYFYCLSLIVRGIECNAYLRNAAKTAETIGTHFRRDIHALVTNSSGPIMPSLRIVLETLVEEILQVPKAGQRQHSLGQPRYDTAETENARGRLLYLLDTIIQIGLADESFQVLFAEIMDRKMTEFVHGAYARVWKTSAKAPCTFGLDKSMNITQTSQSILTLCDWIENHYARLALEVLSRVDKVSPKIQVVSLADIQQWKEIGIGRIASLRISELFDIVIQWPGSKGALDDLKASVTTPQRRWQLTDAFSTALQKRLLHPARSTLDILRVYIFMIRTFHALDHSKVLLSRVVPSLQLYLIQRDDAVHIVVKGLLASPEEVEQAQKTSSLPRDTRPGEGGSGKLVELALLLNDPDQQRRMDMDEEDLDWDDLNWVPDPVDAGVNYKRPKSEDVIGTLINTLGAKDAFIKEFQNIVAENLLSTQTDFAQEKKVLDLLKKRFGESELQNCEVMIKDIYDSRKVDTTIRKVELGQPSQGPRAFGTPIVQPTYMDTGNQLDADEQNQGQVAYNARILSRLYWPNILQETFSLPQPVEQQQKKYEMGYERLKSSRKLTWLYQLGQATIELELEDRTVNVDCKTFEAAVIYAFQQDETAEHGAHSGPVHRTIQELEDSLQMDEEIVLQALDFWETRKVLGRYPNDPNTYVVLERKDQPLTRPELHPAASAPAVMQDDHGIQPGGKPAAIKRAGTTSAMDAKENERRAMYWQFIVGMLTNSMPQAPLGQLAMMMRMLIADGFPWSDQELQEFLAEKVELGELEVVGGKYKLVKK
ncbi:Anaphase-promoting complex subunit 2 [Cytospora mali]|uniref:Anaphase-promoting complex subunit 2 n=1 Tax=Cytospora mali TaxID=578113 RepID=A0A194VNW0_CYTMA|nr:Anaphase-promoting complex subunit 2 [Valsa mali]